MIYVLWFFALIGVACVIGGLVGLFMGLVYREDK